MSILWSLSDTAETELKVQTCMCCTSCKMFFKLCMINVAFATFQEKKHLLCINLNGFAFSSQMSSEKHSSKYKLSGILTC